MHRDGFAARLGLTATLGTTLLAGSTLANTGSDDQTDTATLEAMSARLAELEANNQALQGRVNELEHADGQDWLTEQRAEQIRGVVSDVLADAESRVSLQDGGLTAGWDGGFFLASPDGRFRLDVGGMVQARYMYSEMRAAFEGAGQQINPANNGQADNVTSRSGFDIPAARLEFSGHVFGATRFRLSGNFANHRDLSMKTYGSRFPSNTTELNGGGHFQLLDAWIAHEFDENFSLRVGQFKLPFDRGWEVPVKYQLTGQRDAVSQHFGLGRSQGVELRWTTNQARVRVAVSDGASDHLVYGLYLAGTDPANSPYDYQQGNWSASARGEWNIAGRWADYARMTSPPGEDFGAMIGVGFHAQQNKNFWNANNYALQESGSDNGLNTWFGATADVTLNFGGASVVGAVYYHNIDSNTAASPYFTQQVGQTANKTIATGTSHLIGVSLYAAMYVSNDVELFAGWEYMDALNGLGITDTDEPFAIYRDLSAFNMISLGGNWYIDGEDIKLTFGVDYMPGKVSYGWSTPENGVRGTPDSNEFVIRTQLQLLF
ncbi:MAG: OprO/OprP family phosphate-selective porin [Phycisphaerales bacterium]|nr:OprO/OprP family phosphate-selective porin [Phycisphaerales bacterium]